MKRAGFARPPLPRREREPGEFASHKATPKGIAAGSGIVGLAMQAKPLQPESGPTDAAGRRYMGRVAALGCMLCRRLGYGPTQAEVHHLRDGAGMQQRASDWLSMPLCPEHHRGARGVHGDRSALRQAGVTELDLLADTVAAVVAESP